MLFLLRLRPYYRQQPRRGSVEPIGIISIFYFSSISNYYHNYIYVLRSPLKGLYKVFRTPCSSSCAPGYALAIGNSLAAALGHPL